MRTVGAPQTLWRVSHARPDPLQFSPALSGEDQANPSAGNRFDSPIGAFRMLYCGTNLEACFGETLSRLRPDPAILALVADEWRERHFMAVGTVPKSWRDDRVAVALRVDERPFRAPDGVFVDVEAIETHQALRPHLAGQLAALGYGDLDVGTVRGPDRRVTRAIAQWVWEQADDDGVALYAGIRYLSRLNNDWECWGVFDDAPILRQRTLPITLDMPALDAVAKQFGLQVF